MKRYLVILGVLLFAACSKETPKPVNYIDIEDANISVAKQDGGFAKWAAVDELCKGARIGGYNNWRLPTISELAYLYQHRNTIGEFTNDNYWSSSESAETGYHDIISFYVGTTFSYADWNQAYVRCVRTLME